MIVCVWCRKELRFEPSRGGWVHAASGKLYETWRDANGVERDDHSALPERA